MIKILQVDRDAAAAMQGHAPGDMGWKMYASGKCDQSADVQAFARHRTAGQAELVEALEQIEEFSTNGHPLDAGFRHGPRTNADLIADMATIKAIARKALAPLSQSKGEGL